MEQITEIEGKELPSCLSGCVMAPGIALLCGFALSFLTYIIQAIFNRVPLDNGNYDFTYLFTFPPGAFAGAIATLIWWIKPTRSRLIVLICCVLVFMLAVSILLFNPITDPNDPSFMVL